MKFLLPEKAKRRLRLGFYLQRNPLRSNAFLHTHTERCTHLAPMPLYSKPDLGLGIFSPSTGSPAPSWPHRQCA